MNQKISLVFVVMALMAFVVEASVSERYKTPGLIGGMGPAAACDLMMKVINNTDAKDDQHHVHMLVDQNTDVPDRTAAILKGGADPVPQLTASAKRLEAAGADFLCMSCNTAHYFHPKVQAAVKIPVLHMPAESAKELKRRGIKKVALLATDGTIQTRVYHKVVEAEGIEVLIPKPEDQKTVMRLIYGCVKKNVPTSDYPKAEVAKMMSELKARGAEAFLLACTELPIAFERLGYREGLVDPTEVLARAIVREAGAPLKAHTEESSPRSVRVGLEAWKGLRVSFLGDSITDPGHVGCQKNYWNFLIDDLKLDAKIYGVSGETWAGIEKQVKRMHQAKQDDVDAIFIFMGTNDYLEGCPLGDTFSYREEEANLMGKKRVLKRRYFNFDAKTFRGRINAALQLLKTEFPESQIIILTPIHRAFFTCSPTNVQPPESFPNARGLYIDEYVAAIKDAALLWSCPVIDLYGESGLLPENDQYVPYFANASRDRLHPSTKGHRRLADLIEAKLNALPATFRRP